MSVTLWTLLVLAPLADIPRLGDPTYETREAADRRLRFVPPDLLEAPLGAFVAATEDAEASHRARDLLVRCQALKTHRLQEALDRHFNFCYPHIDALAYSTEDRQYRRNGTAYADVINPYLAYAEASKHRLECYPTYPVYREATRKWVLDLVRSGVALWAVDALVYQMYRNDATYLDQNCPHLAWRAPGWLDPAFLPPPPRRIRLIELADGVYETEEVEIPPVEGP